MASSQDDSLHRLVPIVEVAVASISGFSMIPLFIVLYNTAVLHPNCKSILILSQLAQFGVVSMQVALVVYEYRKQFTIRYRRLFVSHTLSPIELTNGEEFYLFVHEFAYGMSTMLALFLAIERFIACIKARSYEGSGRSYVGIFVVLLISIPISAAWSYISHMLGHYYLGIASILCAEIAVLVLAFALYFYSKRMYQHEKNYAVSLQERYQMDEIVQYSRAFVPSICVSSLIKIIGLVPVFVWQEGWAHYGFMRALFFTAHSINCAVMKNMLLMGHCALRRAFVKTFAVGCMISRRQQRVAAKDNAVVKATDDHFDMLNSVWR